MTPARVLLRTPWQGPWRDFSAPVEIFATRDIGEVRACLAAVDASVKRSGFTAAGFVAYEAAGAFGLPVLPLPDNDFPLVWFGLFPHDRITRVSALDDGRRAYAASDWRASLLHDGYVDRVRRIRTHIEAGDTYQINFTWKLASPFEGDPVSLLQDLDGAQRGRWSAYVDIGRHAICSASPELFFSRDGTRIECRPMKGTAPRGLWSEADRERALSLRTSGKNRAENVMVVDMTRNDLGRVARVGSVRADPLFEVERYPGQWQMVSTVTGDVATSNLESMFAALFPSGSVTGAPKHRSMDIIREVEGAPRGIYTGAIGTIGPERAHFNVAIRTVHVDRDRGLAEFGVGSGIVWDSIDRDEYDECLVKASILTRRDPVFELLESIGWTPEDGWRRLDAHLDRLRDSAEYFGFVMPADDALGDALDRSIAGCRTASKIRLLVGRDGVVRCSSAPLVAKKSPLKAALAAAPIDPASVFLYHKTTMRQVYDEARRSRPDADAVILWNSRGDVTESTEANVVVEIAGRKVTPPVTCGVLPGVERRALLDAGVIQEQRITLEDLSRAGSIWLINSVRGWMPVAPIHSSGSRSL
jgi:para-aminobenzoate synthetase/4-amino-4-deoxychorismate lyase